jgi:H+/Cl- antiporter ClcA
MKEKTEKRKKIESLIGFLLIAILATAFIICANFYPDTPLTNPLILIAALLGVCITIHFTCFMIASSINFTIRLIKKRLEGLFELIFHAEREPYKDTLKDLLITLLLAAILTAISIGFAKIAAYISLFIHFILATFFYTAFLLTITQLVLSFIFTVFKYEGSSYSKLIRNEKHRMKELETHKTLEDK